MIVQSYCRSNSVAPFQHPGFAPCRNSCDETHPEQTEKERGPPMRNLNEPIVLLRVRTELPLGLNLKTSEFNASWDFIRYGRASGLEKKIQKCQWHFMRIAGESLQTGVGETSRQALAGALRLALP